MAFQQNSVIVTEYSSSVITCSDFAPVNTALQQMVLTRNIEGVLLSSCRYFHPKT